MLNYYFSGVGSNKQWFNSWFAKQTSHRLLSLHGAYTRFAEFWCDIVAADIAPQSQTLLYDSGAFTAWKSGHPMTLEELLPTYDYFVNKYHNVAKEIWLISLDKIPGSPGVDPTLAELQEAIEISDKNHEVLVRTFGNRVLPVFHQGEDEKRLREVCELSEYICVSPRNDLHESARVKWSREVHNKMPKGIKTHGLAATGVEMMTTVPWYSVDSATWLFLASTGVVVLCLNGKMVNIPVSNESPAKHIAGRHYNTLRQSEQRVIDAYLERYKMTIDDLRTSGEARLGITVASIIEWNKNHHRFDIGDVPSLFDL